MWTVTAGAPIYPNLYTLLVSPPGVGKSQAINVAYDMWTRVPELHMAPDNVTKASLLDALEDSRRQVLLSPTTAIDYHTMLIAASEFGVFVPAHDLEFLSALNHIYDNPSSYKEDRRTTKKKLNISFPQLTILAGTQPQYLANLLPETAWGMGFTSRIIFVYSGEPINVPLFGVPELSKPHRDSLVTDLCHIASLFGQYRFTAEVEGELEMWNREGRKPAPDHTKLAHYNARRIMHILKLCMVSAISRSDQLLITLEDYTRAKAWLLAAEVYMPDIFRAMVLRSDNDLLQDLHFFMWQLYAKEKRPIHQSRIISFLTTKVPAEKILKIIEIAVGGGLISAIGEELYTPNAKTISPE